MPESREVQNDIAYIRTHVDNLERLVKFQISSNPESRKAIKEKLKAREGAAKIYLALEVPKTQAELQTELQSSQANISKVLRHLLDADLIVKVPSPANRQGSAYARSDLEKVLKVSRIARELLKPEGSEANKSPRGRTTAVSDNGSVGARGAVDSRESPK